MLARVTAQPLLQIRLQVSGYFVKNCARAICDGLRSLQAEQMIGP